MPPLGFVFLLSANCHVLFLRARYAQTVLELRQHTSPSSAPADALKKFDKCRAFCYTIYVRCGTAFALSASASRVLSRGGYFFVLFSVPLSPSAGGLMSSAVILLYLYIFISSSNGILLAMRVGMFGGGAWQRKRFSRCGITRRSKSSRSASDIGNCSGMPCFFLYRTYSPYMYGFPIFTLYPYLLFAINGGSGAVYSGIISTPFLLLARGVWLIKWTRAPVEAQHPVQCQASAVPVILLATVCKAVPLFAARRMDKVYCHGFRHGVNLLSASVSSLSTSASSACS